MRITMKKKRLTISRRQLLKGGALAGAGLFVPWKIRGSEVFAGQQRAFGLNGLSANSEGPDERRDFFADDMFYTAPLVAKIPVAKPKTRIPGVFAYYEIAMKPGIFKFHPQFTLSTPTYGYDDMNGGYIGYLGPTIETRKFEQVAVKWINNLPADPAGPFGLADSNLIPPNLPGGRAVVHVHGMHTVEKYDGGPENWFAPGQTRLYYYPNIQDAASLWYHDHAIGVTRLNVYAGLAGLYLLRDQSEDRLNLPKEDYEIPLILQDKNFQAADGKLNLWYPNPWEPESFGNTILVNAQLWPFLEVEPRRYRFRIYNGANARFFRLRISSTPGGTTSVLPFHQIGAEGGFLPRSAKMDVLLVGNGERADVIVDFSSMAGRELYLSNDAPSPFMPTDAPLDPGSPDFDVMQVMKFKVKSIGGKDKTISIPANLVVLPRLNPAKAAMRRQITLVESPYMPQGVDSGFMSVFLNNRPFMGMDGMPAAPTEFPRLGTSEIWQFINLTPDTHPMHMHFTTFEVIGRQKLAPADVAPGPDDPEHLKYKYGVAGNGAPLSTTGAVPAQYLSGPIMPPEPNETGEKDTVRSNPGEVTYVIGKFEHFTGKFVYHCHILDHEENDMMQYMKVVGPMGKESEGEELAEHTIMPSDHALDQNFPNPFNPETQIRFQIPESSHVTIRIFNTAGQEVASLVNAELQAGWHTVSWNASHLASGAYFYRLEAGSFAAVKRMMLLK
jgi:spore coat protein A